MPLKQAPKGASKKTRQKVISQNIRTEKAYGIRGKPVSQKQAVAVALETDRQSQRKKK